MLTTQTCCYTVFTICNCETIKPCLLTMNFQRARATGSDRLTTSILTCGRTASKPDSGTQRKITLQIQNFVSNDIKHFLTSIEQSPQVQDDPVVDKDSPQAVINCVVLYSYRRQCTWLQCKSSIKIITLPINQSNQTSFFQTDKQ